MATNNFFGLRFTQDAATGAILTSAAGSISFIGPDILTGLTYTIPVPASPGSFPEIQVSGIDPYAAVLDGSQLSTTQMAALQFSIGEVTWGAGLTAQFMVIALSATEQIVIQLGGDAVPIDGTSTPADVTNWQASLTSMGAVTSGPFAPGVAIPFSSIANSTMSPHDTLLGTDLADYFHMGGGKDTVNGGLGDDRIWGDSGKDNLSGGDGNDKIRGGTQNDRIFGGNNDDDLAGEDGNDTISGGAGVDAISGGNGNDRLFGDAGNDSILGGKGDDLVNGGTENDQIDGGKGNDKLLGGRGNDTIVGGKGDDILLGGKGDDSLNGGAGSDTLFSGKGDDLMVGGDGNDILNGGKGSDEMAGGAGDDIMTGGSGTDGFVFYSTSIGNDTITDFDVTVERIMLRDYLAANVGITYTTATDLVSTYASVVGGTDVVFDFLNGDTITLTGVTSTTGLDALLLL
jgi:Ca2+-binding RTX toxin-like protein